MTRMRPSKIADLSLFATLLATACVEEEAVGDQQALAEDLAEDLDGLAAIAPPPGVSVWSEVLFDDGSTHEFVLHTTVDGAVVFEELGAQALAHTDLAAHASEPAPEACSDDAYILGGWRWASRLEWYFHAGTTPSDLSADAAESALAAATAGITASSNGCGLPDEVSASHEYLGRKRRLANISAGGDCLAADGVNMVSFGDLPSGVLATACVWFSDGVAREGDVQLNGQDLRWTTRPDAGACANEWSVRAVMTHERGHLYGLGHVGEGAHGDLTMSPRLNGPCQDSESTLGEGDVQGLRALYAM